MVGVLVFAICLVVAVLLSELFRSSILSASVLFLVAGFVCGPGVLGLIRLPPHQPIVARFAEIALVTVLFSDGMHASRYELAKAWRLPGRALLFGMPLTFALIAALGRWIVGLSWVEAGLVAAVLSPTDPVFASAIVGRKEVSFRLRHLLNVESGLNDGLALPAVLLLLEMAGGPGESVERVLWEIALGVGLGVSIAYVVTRLESSRFFAAVGVFEPLQGFAVGLLVFAVSVLLHANEFLAAFFAGATVATYSVAARAAFQKLGDVLSEIFKLAALMVLGIFLAPGVLRQLSWQPWVFALLVLVVARPAAIELALLGSSLDWKERLAAAWFGPKGFASVVFGLMVLRSNIPNARNLFHLIALVIVFSIVAHSTTDVPMARHLREPQRPEEARA